MLSIPVPTRQQDEDPGESIQFSSQILAALENDLDLEAIFQAEEQATPTTSLGLVQRGMQALATIGRAGDSSGPQRKLFRYWTTGKGGRLRIRWGTDGSFGRCVKLLAKHVPPRYSVKGLCANLHKRATGEWPTEHGKAGIPS